MHLKYLINTKEDLRLLCEYLEDQPIFAYDTETNGAKDRFKIELVGMSFGFEYFGCYLPFNHTHESWSEVDQLFVVETLEALRPYLEDETKAKITHNSKYDEMVMKRYGIDVAGPNMDTLVTSWMLQPYFPQKGDRALKKLVRTRLGHNMVTFEEVMQSRKIKKKDRDNNFAKTSVEDALSYGADDSYWVYKLHFDIMKQLKREKLWSAYQNVDGPFIRVTGDMEDDGVAINHDYIATAAERFPQIAEEVEGRIYKHAEKVFNIGAPQQLGNVLFRDMKIQGKRTVPRSPKTGNYVTDKKVLAKFENAHPIMKDLKKYKKVTKTFSTFVDGLQRAVGEDGRVHAIFNGCGTRTGRLSSSSPNLQNIEGGVVEDIKIRNFFVAAEGCSFIVSDYSQIELRVMAHLAKDKTMIEAFLSGMDFHDATAREMLKVKEVDRLSRIIAKTLNFGVGYGRGPQGIAEQIGCTVDEAEEFIAKWFSTFDGVAEYKKHVVRQARKEGFVRTITGRKRRLLPDIRSDIWKLRMGAERRAFNTKIQGSAADIIKMSMISMAPKLRDIDSKIVIQIHDELVVEVPDEHLDEGYSIVKDNMEKPLNGKNPLRLPLVTDPCIVKGWGDVEK